MAEKKRQHIIPKCYLRAWCDPLTPAGQHPFIWRITKDGSEKKKKSPEKSFTAIDKYTIKLPDGGRNLVIENTLGGVEQDFVTALSRIRRREKLNALDRARLCMFTAAMQARTTAMGEHWKKQQQQIHEQVVALEKAHNSTATLSLETAQYLEVAHQHIIVTALKVEAPILFQMQITILVATDELGFITSDNPCVWFNPNLHKMPPFYRQPGLSQKDIEVTLPLTPHHLLTISHHQYPAYVDVNQKAVDEFNRRAHFHCSEEFVSWKGETRPHWFERGQEPEDTWEKSQDGKRALETQHGVHTGLHMGENVGDSGEDPRSALKGNSPKKQE